mmetsp:Transcript_10672/g.26536  ORF Transcript_10672/g.26536 Transcript_10672/m.26536 type:complete len:290 (-) Transcript_10672:505-1374(-)|eukprot:CAMPEP_0195590436 /NCGR_PEP_ID=MMETSP0814-20130614/34141_1 /TAXON_ID=97485 /ORGANISM="Prymnesium parvum, Strain Texoma1" /LENGTH=289 /DNA_ID=CAMNT_0040729473 /DNA_START=70 /DNA_END=939 /DNA_ORIENTATION=+
MNLSVQRRVNIIFPARVAPVLARDAAEVVVVDRKLEIHLLELLREGDSSADALLHAIYCGLRVEALLPLIEPHHPLLLIDGGAYLARGHHVIHVLLRLRQVELRLLRDVLQREREVRARQSQDVSPLQRVYALLRQSEIMVCLQCARVLLQRRTQAVDVVREESLRKFLVSDTGRALYMAPKDGGGVLWHTRELAEFNQGTQPAFLVCLQHDGVQDVSRRGESKGEVLDGGLEPLEANLDHPSVVVVKEQVARSHVRAVLIDLQQFLLEQRLRGVVALGEQAELHALCM